MSSFTRFVSKANSMLSDVFGALGIGGEGCTFTLSGGGESVSFPVSPASDKTNSVTGMKGRMSDVLKEKPMTCLGGLDMMDTAQKAIQRTTSIAKQCKRVVNTYRAMAKSGGIRPGVLLKTTAKGIFKAGGKLPMVKW